MTLDRLNGWIFIVAGGLFPLVGLFAPLGLAPLGILVGLSSLPIALRDKLWRNIPRSLLIVACLLCVWLMASSFWAIDPREALAGATKQVVTMLGGLAVIVVAARLDDGVKHWLKIALFCSFCLSALILGLEYLGDRMISEALATLKGEELAGRKSPLNRGATILALSSWVLLSMMAFSRKVWPHVLVILAMGVIFLGDSGSTRVALGAGILAALFILAWPRGGLRLGMVLVASLWIAAPLAAVNVPSPQYTFRHWDWLPTSSHHRTTIWGYTGRLIAEKPVLGWGMEASRNAPDGDHEIQLWRVEPDGTLFGLREALLPLHPHSAVLQVWFELGAVGAGLVAAFLILALFHLDRAAGMPRRMRAAAASAFVSGLIVALISFGIWQSWWQSGLWLAAAFTLSGASRGPKALQQDEKPGPAHRLQDQP